MATNIGSYLWDFSKLNMQFTMNGKNVSLQGLSYSANKFVREATIQRDSRKKGRSFDTN